MARSDTAEDRSGEAFDRVPVQVYPDGRLDRENAARYLGRTPRTLEMWAWRRKGPRPRNVGGRVFYFLKDLDEYIAAGEPPSAEVPGRTGGGARTIAAPSSTSKRLRAPIAELGLTGRCLRSLQTANLVYIGDLVQRSESDLLRVTNFGRKALDEVKEVLAERGLQLAARRR
jgi:DNA-directed RNA polymerase subunit alpha